MNTSMQTYLVTQEDRSAGRSTTEIVEAAIDGGIDIVQLREKETTARRRYEIGQTVRTQTAQAGVTFLVNDRVDLAAAVNADGVHLGDDDLPVTAAREVLGQDAIIGRSVSTPAAAQRAEDIGADYLGVGAVYPTGTKDVTAESAEIGPKTVTAITDAVSIPVIGIGGITPSNTTEVIRAGADGVAVVSAITTADDPAAATRKLQESVDTASVESQLPSEEPSA
ncbi:thiamine phosphate synthase [Haloquadratum walsbyi]|jgi:thiamine-phosphate pyrophosphorylase|uniref:Thiamine-phosphate synthase n=1 Tax=Haloquadratum walsbyi (strain DSM 16854 / JCM 12705 / C23) TaxID=768065 RepID=G0LLH5_HALWC|nr:thiamine phosphate synthase [Haloquadratum walsbyi]CCC40781.1 thiamine-phosphate synthase [Haloquadratum walsbyi C23]